MQVEDKSMQRLGHGGENPSSLEGRAGAFLFQARPTMGLTDVEIGAIERRLLHRITSPCPQCSGATVVGDSRLLGRQRDRAGRSDGGHGGSLQIRRSVFTA